MQCNLHKADKRVMGSCKLLSWSGMPANLNWKRTAYCCAQKTNAYWHIRGSSSKILLKMAGHKSHRGWRKIIVNVLAQGIFGHPRGQTLNGGSSAYSVCLKPYMTYGKFQFSKFWKKTSQYVHVYPQRGHWEKELYFRKVHHSRGITEHFHAFFSVWGVGDQSQKLTKQNTVSLLSN